MSGFLEGMSDRGAYLAMVQAYNAFLADYCSVAPDRLIGNGVIPSSGIDDAVSELERCAELGLRTVTLHKFPNGSASPTAADDRFWERALALRIAVSPHGSIGDGRPPIEVGAGPYRTFAGYMSIHSSGPCYSIAQLIAAGVFDRFPDLRVYFAE